MLFFVTVLYKCCEKEIIEIYISKLDFNNASLRLVLI